MGEDQHVDRQLSRDQFLRKAAVAGGAVLLPGALASAANALTTESGSLQVLDWAGYGNDGGQPLFAQYVRAHPDSKPRFTYMTNESDALAKLRAGLKADLFRPYAGWLKYFATSGLVQ